MASTITRRKAVPAAVEAVRLLRENGMSVHLSIAGRIGNSNSRAPIESLIRTLGLEEHVTVLGPRNDIPELMGTSDLVIHTSLSEGFGNVLIEAMAAGVPVIASDIPACREVLDDGRAGILVPPGDPGGLAAAIERILGSDAERARMAEAGRERVRAEFDSSHMAAGYSRLLASSLPVA
jgi:glycosyltransferase involved in cell wall biosynthesis